MKYKFLYWKWHMSQRQVAVMDLQEGRLITFTVDAFDELDEGLQEYVKSVRDLIKSPHWESK